MLDLLKVIVKFQNGENQNQKELTKISAGQKAMCAKRAAKANTLYMHIQALSRETKASHTARPRLNGQGIALRLPELGTFGIFYLFTNKK